MSLVSKRFHESGQHRLYIQLPGQGPVLTLPGIEELETKGGEVLGVPVQVSARRTLMSIQHEVAGRFRIGAERSRPALPLEQWQRHALAFAYGTHRDDTGNGPAAFGDHDPLLGQILQQCQALAAELGDAYVSQNGLRPPPHFGAGLGFGSSRAVGFALVV